LKEPCHPLDLGADICCDSAHKTLSALTGGAYLHISKNADREYLLHAREALSLFASSSPSYLILESLDACNAYLDGKYKDELSMASERVLRLREAIEAMGIPVYHGEPLKLVIKAYEIGYSWVELGAHMRNNGIEIEFCDVDFAVLMMTPQNSERDGDRLIAALRKLEIKKPIERAPLRILPVQRAMSIREATFCMREKIKVADAAQRVCADSCLSCPPCVPVAVSGERITSDTVELLKYYGIDEISVVI
jgi:arginine/lysine/ornithine decarboxylase